MPLPQAAQHAPDGGYAPAPDTHEPRGGGYTPRDPVDWLATPWNTGGIPVTPGEPASQGAGGPSPGDRTIWDREGTSVTPGEMTPWDAGIPRGAPPHHQTLPPESGAPAAAPDPTLDSYRPPDPPADAYRPPASGPAGSPYGGGDDGPSFTSTSFDVGPTMNARDDAAAPYGTGDTDPPYETGRSPGDEVPSFTSTRFDVGPTMNARDDARRPYATGDGPPVAGTGDAATHPFNVLDDAGLGGAAGGPSFTSTRLDVGPALGEGDGPPFTSTRLDVGPTLGPPEGAGPVYGAGEAGRPYGGGPAPAPGAPDPATHPFGALGDPGSGFAARDDTDPYRAPGPDALGDPTGFAARDDPDPYAPYAPPAPDALADPGSGLGARDDAPGFGDGAAGFGARDDSGPYAPPAFGARDAGASPDTGETRYVPLSAVDEPPLTERFGVPTPADGNALDDDDGMRYPIRGATGERPLAGEPGPRYPVDDDSGPRYPLGDDLGPRYPLGDDLGPRYPLGDDLGPRYPLDDDDGMRYPLFDDEDEDEGGMRYPGIKPSTGDGIRRSGRSLRTPIAAGFVVAALVGGIVLYGALHGSKPQSSRTSGSSGAPAPNSATSSPALQAVAVNAILQSGTDSHDKLAVAMSTCDDLSAAVPVFQQVVQDRERELGRARQVQVDQLPKGTALRQAMVDAYANSLDADRAYLAWTQEVKAKNCGKKNAPRTPNYAAALAANGKARSAKRRVATLWTPIAQQQSLPVYKWNQL